MKTNSPSPIIQQVQMTNDALEKMKPMLEQINANVQQFQPLIDNLQSALQLASLGQQHKKTIMALQSSLSVPLNPLLPDRSFLDQLKAVQTIASQVTTPSIEINRKIELPPVSYPEGTVYSWVERETYSSPNLNTSGDVFVYRDVSEVLDSRNEEATTPTEREFISDVKSWIKDPQNLTIALMTVNIAVDIAIHFFSRRDLEQANFYITLAKDILEVLSHFSKRIN